METEIKTPEVTTLVKPAKVTASTSFENKVPSLWTILPGEEEDTIVATSNSTQETFEGTIEEFNERLK
jgi:hypothetical protein